MQNKLTPEIAMAFVEHIQEHLDKGHKGLKSYKLPESVVGCAICGETIWEIGPQKQNLIATNGECPKCRHGVKTYFSESRKQWFCKRCTYWFKSSDFDKKTKGERSDRLHSPCSS